MDAIESAYEDLEAEVTLEEFREAVDQKVEQMAGLADEETAALLVAHELDENRVRSIGDLDPDLEQAKFVAKVRRVGEHRTFERDDGEDGHVINVEALDETGEVRLAFWDDHATAIDEEGLEPGTVLKIQGRPTAGMHGLEVSVEHVEPASDIDIDVDLDATRPIADLQLGQSSVRLRGRVLDTEPVRTFDRDDGSEGRVSNLALGDETGRIRVTLWDDRALAVEDIVPGDCIEIRDGSVRERDDELEVHCGDRGAIEVIDEMVEFRPETVPISAVEPGDVVDVAGVIRSTDEKRTFERDDGSEGQVRNVRLQDQTGDVRVALWGDAADRELAPGDTVWFGAVEVRDGWQDDVELSVGWRSSIAPVDLSAVTTERPVRKSSADETASLATFEEVEADDTDSEGESISIIGTVVQTGDPIIVDDGNEALHVHTDADPILGQEVRVEGRKRDDTVDAERVVTVESDGDGKSPRNF